MAKTMSKVIVKKIAETSAGAAAKAETASAEEIRRLRRAELPRHTLEMARFLIGKTLVHDISTAPGGASSPGNRGRTSSNGPPAVRPIIRLAGRIVETEAYPPGDAAAHSFRGETQRNRSLFLERGFSYVYFTYGCWFAMNVSSESHGTGAGVLLRGLEPLEGLPIMQANRRASNRAAFNDRGRKDVPLRVTDLARGPGRLASAMQIDKRCDGLDLCGANPLWLGTAVRPAGPIGVSIRIGISREAHRLYRFYEIENPHVSGPRRLRTVAPWEMRSRTDWK
jgi:DNA-3-methyladenine glycosylase